MSAAQVGGEGPKGTTQAYCRCNSGHYFQGEFCPFDGWSSAASRELTAAVKRLAGAGQEISLPALRQAGVGQATLGRTIIVQFGSLASAFEALAPQEYVVHGQAKPVTKLDHHFK